MRNKLLPVLPVKKFDDRPAHCLMHDEIFSLKREKNIVWAIGAKYQKTNSFTRFTAGIAVDEIDNYKENGIISKTKEFFNKVIFAYISSIK